MPGRLEFELDLGRQGSTGAARKAPGPMRLLVLGDFSGRPAAERPPLAGRPTHAVDLDRLDKVLHRLSPSVNLAHGSVGFEQVDDFHPDRLHARLAVFASLRDMRARLADPRQFAQAAAELGVGAFPAADAQPMPAAAATGDDLLAGLLGGRPAAAPASKPKADSGIDALLRNIVAPHIVPDAPPHQALLIASVDQAATAQMRSLLHDPAFQALESAWRGVQWLVNSLELDENLQLHLFDATRDEIQADLVAAKGQVEQTALHQALVSRWRGQPGALGWTLMTGLYSFGPGDADIAVLAALGLLASQAGAPLLAAARPEMLGATSFDTPIKAWSAPASWQALRQSQAAPWIGLAAPRVLLRLPYGTKRDPVECFAFEELGPAPANDEWLWGNGAVAVALLIARAFSARGWDFEPGDENEIGDLPACTVDRDGEPDLQACAEFYLGETVGQAMLEAGLMPLLSHRHRNAVTVMRFQSVAEPVGALAGLVR